jgi:GNAT superfamily N-acetyltransferase
LGTEYSLDLDAVSLGEEIPASSVAILRKAVTEQLGTPSTRDETLFKAITKISGAKNPSSAFYNENFDKSIAFFMQFLREDDPNITVDEAVEKVLERGIKYKSSSGVNTVAPFGSIIVPFKVERSEENSVGAVVPSVEMSSYRASIGVLRDFYSNNSTPNALRPEKTSLVISATSELAAAEYTRVTGLVKKEGFSGVQGVNVATNTYGNVVPVTNENESLDLIASTVTNNTIIINHESASKTPSAFQIDPIVETVLHEYGHTVESNVLGVTWGWNANLQTEAYAEVKATKISEYGENNIREHFAESFAKYLGTGSASPEFVKFLKESIGIGKFSLEDYVPKQFQGTTFFDNYEKYINENADLNGYTLKLGSVQTNNSDNMDMRSLANSKGNSRFFGLNLQWSARILDSQGRDTNSTLSRTLTIDRETGEIRVGHSVFSLDPSIQGMGLGDKITDAAIEYYKSVGVQKIKTSAAASGNYPNGAYMWALKGFDFLLEEERIGYHNQAKLAYQVLGEYGSDSQKYDAMTLDRAVNEIAGKTMISMYSKSSIERYIKALRDNGWVLSNDLINQLKYVAEKNPAEVTAQLIAEIGRGNKKDKGKDFSTLGRTIMKYDSSGWSAVMELKN